MSGGILVTKVSTGTLFIADIRTNVTHGESTYISADNYLNSTDLHRAINSKLVKTLVDSMPQVPVKPAQQPVSSREELLLNENIELREALARSLRQGDTLQAGMSGLEGKLGALLAVVERIDAAPKVVQVLAASGVPVVAKPVQEASEAVPVFVPDDLIPENAEVRISFQTETSEGDTTSNTVSKLRQLRRGGAGS